ncbi:MAG: para-aminobenzoate synthetase component 1 [Litorivivens sp.]
MKEEHPLDEISVKDMVFLNSNDLNKRSYLGIGSRRKLVINNDNQKPFDALKEFWNHKKSWLMGYLSYDLKNSVEKLDSRNHDKIGAALIYFIEPASLFYSASGKWVTVYNDLNIDPNKVMSEEGVSQNGNNPSIPLKSRVSKETYSDDINTLLRHIHRGDIYEVNYCQEFYAENVDLDLKRVYSNLNELTQAPFSCFASLGPLNIISASPERFICKKGQHVISQPIKGTIKRGQNIEEDNLLKEQLRTDPKERSENIMITDLVRNDLSHHAEKGSVKVDELCAAYSFKTVHQLISTVSAEIKVDTHWVDIIQSAFPMGSMTGAPKVRAMELIEEQEKTKRGIYSGTIGYVSPEGDFDFNVIIRSLVYNRKTKYLSAMVGGAITAASTVDREYEECMLKASALKNALLNE